MLRDKAIAYLRNLHGLEIMAGLNFRIARNDLAGRGRLPVELDRRLDIAFRQEIRHAVQVRRILAAFGYRDKRELTAIMARLEGLLAGALLGFSADQHACVRILLNRVLEEGFAGGGNDETFVGLLRVIAELPSAGDRDVGFQAAVAFRDAVAREEPEHIAIDNEVLEIYSGLYPDLDPDLAIRRLRGRGLSSHPATMAKRRFIKRAQAA